jgi:hypothetical protein
MISVLRMTVTATDAMIIKHKMCRNRIKKAVESDALNGS